MTDAQAAPAADERPAGRAGGRVRAHAAAQRHSVWVRSLKIAIPSAAIVVAGVFAFGMLYNPFGKVAGLTLGPISLSGSKIKMDGPRLTGFRPDSRPYEVTATAAFQDIRRPNVIELKDMVAKLVMDQAGTAARLVSPAGLFDATREHLELTKDIRISTDRGDEAQLRSAAIDFKAGTIVSREPVRIATPGFVVEAEGVHISDNGSTIVFDGRVRTQLLSGPRDRAAAPASAGTGLVIRQVEAEARPR